MKKVRIILMSKGKIDCDYYSKMNKPNLEENISIGEGENCTHYTIKFIQYFFNEKGEFLYTMITGIK